MNFVDRPGLCGRRAGDYSLKSVAVTVKWVVERCFCCCDLLCCSGVNIFNRPGLVPVELAIAPRKVLP
ncbi:hypothetical protein [Pantoea stewartii]|uniref:hypothetical protein n=1 Tax=Pantoea stewartii TaxID=66269 RepID=UPI0025A29D66|nr:hypothetical protein [Pantoea stewartii]